MWGWRVFELRSYDKALLRAQPEGGRKKIGCVLAVFTLYLEARKQNQRPKFIYLVEFLKTE
jgi:hypothetical protein